MRWVRLVCTVMIGRDERHRSVRLDLADDPFSGLDVRECETEVGFHRHDHAPLDVERWATRVAP